MTSLLNENLIDALCIQLSQEKFNAQLYLYIAGFLRNKGLNNLASHFIHQHDEETDHAKLIFDFLTNMNADVELLEIPAVETSCNNIGDVARVYLEREIQTTDSLNSIKQLAVEQVSPLAEEFMRTMLQKQIAEMDEAYTFADKAELTGNNWAFVLLWDASLK